MSKSTAAGRLAWLSKKSRKVANSAKKNSSVPRTTSATG